MNLAQAFALSVEKSPQKTAVFWGDAAYTYGGLHWQSEGVSTNLRDRFDIKRGDRVGLWLKNRPEFIPALYGVLQLGAVVVPINSFFKPEEVGHILDDAGIDVLITERSLAHGAVAGHGAGSLSAQRPRLRLVYVDDFPAAPPSEKGTIALPAIAESDLAVLIYTSGTTGRPKGAMLTHGNLLHNVESCRRVLQAVDCDRFILLLPMFHSFMLCVCIFLPLTVGGLIVLIKSLHPPKNIFQEIIEHQGTILPGIPQFFRTMANSPIPPQLPLRICVSGAAPLPGEILREFNSRFPIPLLEGYGLSEASPVVSINPVRGPWKSGSIGVPIPKVEVTVQNDAGETLPPGQVGEICVRGGNVMRGYWNQPEETARAFRNGWLLTGDVGYGDQDGFFYVTDRKKDMLLVNGINVYPREIEEVIYQIPGVKEVAVVGMPDSRKGEQPVAFIALNDGVGLTEKEVVHFVRARLADYKVPRKVNFLAVLPRNATGKITKTALRHLLA